MPMLARDCIGYAYELDRIRRSFKPAVSSPDPNHIVAASLSIAAHCLGRANLIPWPGRDYSVASTILIGQPTPPRQPACLRPERER